MAVTIHDSPQSFMPSDNPINWTFSSDQTAQPNFSFLIEVYIGGVHVANELIFPDNGIYGRFDASSYTAQNCDSPIISDSFFTDANNYNYVSIKVIERYGDPVADGADSTSADVYYFKAKLEDEDFVDWSALEYVINPGLTKSWLTNFPGGDLNGVKPLLRRTGEQFRMMVINNGGNIANLKIELFDSTGLSVSSWMATPSTSSNIITIFNFTPSVIISSTSITQTDFDNSAYMSISSTNYLEAFYVELNDACDFEHRQRIHFLSKIGSVESFTFELISRQQSNIKSYTYEKSFGEWNGSAFEYNKEQGRSLDIAKVSNREMIIESDWINQTLQHWLIRNLYESPCIWIETDDKLLRRAIKNTSWMDKYNSNDTLFKEQITLKLPTHTSMVL